MRMNWIERFRGHSQAWIATAVVACPIAVAMGATSLRAMLVQEGSAASSGGAARASEGDEASGIGSSSGGVATLVGEIAPASPVSPLDIAQEPLPASQARAARTIGPAQPRAARTIGPAQPTLPYASNKFDDPVVGWATAPSRPQGALPPNPPMAPSGNVAGFAPYSSYQVANFYHAPTSPEDQKLSQKSMQLAQRLRAPDLDDEERKKIQEELKGVVEAQFKSRQEHRTKELEQLKKQVAELEKNLQDREKRQSEIVDRRVAELSGKGDPLGWDFQSSRQGPAPFGINGTQVSQFGTNGFSFYPATDPFATTQPATMPPAAAATPTQNAPRSFSGPPIQTGSAPGPIETRPAYPNATRQNSPDGAVRQMENKIKQLEETIRKLERSNRPDNKTTDATY